MRNVSPSRCVDFHYRSVAEWEHVNIINKRFRFFVHDEVEKDLEFLYKRPKVTLNIEAIAFLKYFFFHQQQKSMRKSFLVISERLLSLSTRTQP